jgi:acetolactate synthase I/II/III large subunit
MKGAQFLVSALEREGVRVVFGYPGGAIMPVYDALRGSSLRHVLVRHEQAAVFAADGYARASGEVGVCIATSGPGATNLVTGIANAHLDSVPLVAITGQVPTALLGTDAFQEVDILGITMPVVKHGFLVRRAEDLPFAVHEAFRIARSGRPGPVLLDLPKDVAAAEGAFPFVVPRDEAPAAPSPADLARAVGVLLRAKRPLVYAGGGIALAHAVEEFRAFVETTQIPTVATLKGLGALPGDHPLFLGMLGMHGAKAANLAVQASDALVCIGARFDDRATGRLDQFASGARVVHVDVDASEVGKLRSADAPVVGDMKAALRALAVPLTIEPWRQECLARKLPQTQPESPGPAAGVDAPSLLSALSRAADDDTIVTCDVGQHQMWVAQHWLVRRPERHLSSGGLGAMGYGLPAAIGAQLAHPEACVVNVTGDGSILMNVQELVTLRRHDLPVKVVLLDNRALGMVRQWQELFFDGRESEVDLSDNPDFVRVAESFGIAAFRVASQRDVPAAIERLLRFPGPVLAHVAIARDANVWPLVPPGLSNAVMLEGASR